VTLPPSIKNRTPLSSDDPPTTVRRSKRLRLE
jgi:hypothetical protein